MATTGSATSSTAGSGLAVGDVLRVLRLDIYARLSYALNGDTINVEYQEDLCTDELHSRGAVVGEVFKDNSLSAWNPKVERPSWDAMMARLESGASDGVIFYDAFRFSRKIMEGERLIEAAANGARIWSLSGEYRLTTADGRAAFRDAMVKAAAESDKTSERVKHGNIRRARKGRMGGGWRGFAMPGLAPRPKGWERGDPRKQVPAAQIEAERAVAAECIERLRRGELVHALVAELNQRAQAGELGCATARGGLWTHSTLARTLQRPALVGMLRFKEGTEQEIVRKLADIAPVVDTASWDQFRSVMSARRTGRPPVATHLLTGVCVCVCGGRLKGYMRGARGTYEDGLPWREYRCVKQRSWDVNCGRSVIDGRFADEVVAEAVKARLGDPQHAQGMAARLARTETERIRIKSEIARWDGEADALSGKVKRWGVERVNRQMEPILDEIDKLTAELEKLDESQKDVPAQVMADSVRAWEEAAERGDVVALRRLVRYAFPRLTLALPRHQQDNSPARFLWNGMPQTQQAV